MEKKNIEYIEVSKLIPYAQNAKKHSSKQIESIAKSIETFGFNAPILVDKDNGIIAGHGRFEASKKLNLKTVPVIVLDHLSEEEKRAYILADNKLSEIGGGYDEIMLAEELSNIEKSLLLDAGFSDDDLNRALSSIDLEMKIQSEPEHIAQDTSNRAADRILAKVKKMRDEQPDLFNNNLVVISEVGCNAIVIADGDLPDFIEEITRLASSGENFPLSEILNMVHKI